MLGIASIQPARRTWILKAVFLKKLSMTAYAMGRYATTRRKTRAGTVVPRSGSSRM